MEDVVLDDLKTPVQPTVTEVNAAAPPRRRRALWRLRRFGNFLRNRNSSRRGHFMQLKSWSRRRSVRNDLQNIEKEPLLENSHPLEHDLEIRGVQDKFLAATFLPDVVIEVIKKNDLQTLPLMHEQLAVVMFVNVMGFATLNEIYTVSGTKGTEELSAVISTYLTSVVSFILAADGDVIKYTGDYFLCAWFANAESDFPKTVKLATECALHIQQRNGQFETDDGVVIRINLAIAAGKLQLHLFGLPEFSHFSVDGSAVDKAKVVQDACVVGDVLLSKEAWEYLQKNVDCKFESQPNEKGFTKMLPLLGHFVEGMAEGREKILESCSIEDLADMERFLMPLMRNIDSKKLLEYLTEMRQVTVLFINVNETDSTSKQAQVSIDKVFSVVYVCLNEMEGALNKVISFDKGFTFFAVFGLPGYKHKHESTQALYCASRIVRLLGNMSIKCSIGVSTGTCFCGILGHPHRQEYTIVGDRVNLAYCLMADFADNSITCDDDTYFRSRQFLGPTNFLLLEPKELKCVPNKVSHVYEFRWNNRESAIGILRPFVHPIVGLTSERRAIRDLLLKTLQHKSNSTSRFAIIEGEHGCGKSHTLHWTSERASKMGFRTITCCPKVTAIYESYGIVHYMMMQLCSRLLGKPDISDEDSLRKLIPQEHHKHLFFLNDVFSVQFPVLRRTLQEGVNRFTKKKEKMYSLLLDKICNRQAIALIIDDAHHVDVASWDFLSKFLVSIKSLCVLALPLHPDTSRLKSVLTDSVVRLRLSALKPLFLAAIGCQYLGTVGLHKEVEQILRNHGNNSAVWCQELLQYLKDRNVVKCVSVKEIPSAKLNSQFLFPKEQFLSKMQESLVCDLNLDETVKKVDVPENMQMLILQRLSHLEPQEILLLQVAAVCGAEIDIQLLEKLNLELSHKQVADSVAKFISLSILECARYKENEGSAANSRTAASRCLCPLISSTDVCCCQRPVFQSILIQNTVYRMLTSQQMEQLHTRAHQCLEEFLGTCCPSCTQRKKVKVQDMRSCSCHQQQLNINLQLAYHCNILNRFEESIKHFQGAVRAYIALCNYPEALKLARQVVARSDDLFDNSANEQHRNLHIESLRLLAEAKLHMQMMKEAMKDINRAFELLNRNLTTDYVAGEASQYVKNKLGFGGILLEAKCLGVASEIYFGVKNSKSAQILADHQLEFISQEKDHQPDVVWAYLMKLKCSYAQEPLTADEELESNVLDWCNERLAGESISIDEIICIISCYSEILTDSFYRNNIDTALDVGFKLYKLTRETSDLPTQIAVLPLLSQALLFKHNTSKCLDVLSHLREISEESHSQVGLVLYYAGLAELIIQQDFHTEGDRLKECKEFLAEFYFKDSNISEIPDFDFYLFATMTRWCLRFGLGSDDTDYEYWMKKAETLEPSEDSPQSYWALSGAISMLDVRVQEMRKLFQEPVSKLRTSKQKLLKTMQLLEINISHRYPVLLHRIEDVNDEMKEIWEILRFMQY